LSCPPVFDFIPVQDPVEQALWLVEAQSIDVVLLDLNLVGGIGLDALQQIKRRRPGTEVVAMASNGTVQSAVRAMKAGAFDCLPKPFGMQDLKLLLEEVSRQLQVKTERRALLEKNKSARGFGSLIGRTPKMEQLYRIISKAAQSNHSVLILGESGFGQSSCLAGDSAGWWQSSRDTLWSPAGSMVSSAILQRIAGLASALDWNGERMAPHRGGNV